MKCPHCQYSDTKVTDTRVAPDQSSIRRRRKCPECGYKFSTLETLCPPELVVIKRNLQEEEFDSEKIASGLRKAIKADALSEKKIEHAMQQILNQIQGNHTTKITSEEIGQIVMQVLKERDPIAYLRFASIYKNFHETHEFEQEVKNLHPD